MNNKSATDKAREVISDAKTRHAELVRKIAAEQRELHVTDFLIGKAEQVIERSKPTPEFAS